ncbi:MAG: radical SAM family heme chaperone HemW [Bacteroidetes bacterium]|nr:radical SAM family heme chaperone HemW [Bacteroidota bacterium]
MAGIYLHIPFCRQACHYCNFHFSTSLNRKNDFIPALLKEMQLRKDYTGGDPIETIYFGGGTPSLLSTGELTPVFDRLHALFPISPAAEITLEANPDDISPVRLREWRALGINRLSIGVQSFFDEDLRWMNRAHDAGQAAECIAMARAEGFDNISIDLIYGGPTLPDSNWKYNVDRAISLQVPHLSCYALTVEPRTALDTMIHQQKKQDVIPEDQARQFLLLMDWTTSAGYEHYEISNFARPGRRSRHNSSYWQGKTYLGLGPSAHSFNGISREWNLANNAKYISADGSAIAELEVLTATQQLNEYIMISLRTCEGCSLPEVLRRWGADAARQLEKDADAYILTGKMRKVDGRLQLTPEGKLLADGIASQLFFELAPS